MSKNIYTNIIVWFNFKHRNEKYCSYLRHFICIFIHLKFMRFPVLCCFFVWSSCIYYFLYVFICSCIFMYTISEWFCLLVIGQRKVVYMLGQLYWLIFVYRWWFTKRNTITLHNNDYNDAKSLSSTIISFIKKVIYMYV